MGIIDRIKGSYDAGAETAAKKRAEHARRVEEARKAEQERRVAAKAAAKAQPIKAIATFGAFVETTKPYVKGAAKAAQKTGKVLQKTGKAAAGAAGAMSPPPRSRRSGPDPLDSMFLTSQGPAQSKPRAKKRKKRSPSSSSQSNGFDDIGRLW